MISVIAPIYNEAENIEELCQRVTHALESIGEDFEFILVENGSTDSSFEIIKSLHANDPRIKWIRLSRNFGPQGAIMAALEVSRGDAVISLDGDLQHPPELIPELVRRWREGCEVVYTTKKLNRESGGRCFFMTRLFYWLVSSISDIHLNYGQTDYRLLDRKVADVILKLPEKHKFLRGMVHWIGFSQTGVEYAPDKRKKGESKFSLRHYIAFALDGIFSFSIFPLRVFLYIGLALATFCAIWGFYYVIMGLITMLIPESNLLPPGSATITVAIFFLGGVQLIGIGILGEYIGRVYFQTKQRPDFIIKDKDLG